MQRITDAPISRARAVGTLAAGAGVLLVGAGWEATRTAKAATRSDAALQSILDTALLAERISTTFYYAGLTAPPIIEDHRLGGGSRDPSNPALPPGGNPSHVRYLQAALDAEVKHAALLVENGARPGSSQFYFPATTFKRLGTAKDPGTFLGMLEQLETILAGMYTAAVYQLSAARQLDLTILATGMAGIQAEHRMLGRVIAGIRPANNLALEKEPYATVDAARRALDPFVTGKDFSGGATHAIALPTSAQTAQVIGKYGTRRVRQFL